MNAISADLQKRAAAWLSDDPDPETRGELSAWIAEEKVVDLEDAFSQTLEFGTAGLRGLLGPGPNRMNHVVVSRATAGLCAHLLATVPNAATRGIAIGFDGRKNSREFANDVAEIVAGFGIRALAFDQTVATPMLAFAVKHLGCAAGVMVTASHNPPAYNGYKVYWENGAQIIPPIDGGIAHAIEKVGTMASIPRMTRAAATAEGRFVLLGESIENDYFKGISALPIHTEVPRDITVAYTAMHGVGNRFFLRAMKDAGYTRVHSVAAQAEPDARFPTVAFPNPEEKGAMDLLLALAKETNADIALANDPDADRLAVAIRDRDGKYVTLSGNEVGQVLAHYCLSEDRGPKEKRLVASSVVSSPMIGAIASHHGARWEQTLTGFKWIANRAMEIEASDGLRFILGYEEALGYTIGTLVRDKDGIGAALVMSDLASWCKLRGRSVLDELETAFRTYGLYLSRQISLTMPGKDGSTKIGHIMNNVRASLPTSFGDAKIVEVRDLGTGELFRDGKKEPLLGEKTNLIVFALDGGHRVMLRPSGTEPKIKYYFDYRVELRADETLAAGRARGDASLDAIVHAFRGIVDAAG